ncbi:MAG: glycosyltransferase family 9 protein [Proteobacteria bacterium]|jgi:heptosyltransferase II|nr:glycosyltransferase family 9 protein [Pseudomonadota bacterium]
MKVLVVQQRMGIGDMVIFLPYIHALSKKFQSKVSLLVKKNSKAEDLYADDGHVGEIINLDINKNNSGRHNGWMGFLKLIKEIKEKKFDKVFIFNGSIRFLFLAKLAGIKSINQYPLFIKKDNIVQTAKRFTEQFVEKVSTQPFLYLDQKKIEKAKTKYEFNNDFKHICLGFSASGPSKRWPIEKYIKLAEDLNKNKPCKFYLAGGQNDEELFKKFLSSSIANNCISFKDLSISETLPIIKNSDMYIGNDTGWLHIASALNKKCVALFMDSPVQAYGKYSKNISVIVPEGETEETTTHNTYGKDRISFEKVLDKSLELLN